MGVDLYYERVTPEQLAEIRRDPERRIAILDAPSTEERAERSLVIDGDWDDLGTLLHGHVDDEDDPLTQAIEGGDFLTEDPNDEDFTTFLTPVQVRAVAEALNGLNETTLRARYFSPDFGNWRSKKPASEWRPPDNPDYLTDDDRDLDSLLYFFSSLRLFFDRATAAGDAVVINHA